MSILRMVPLLFLCLFGGSVFIEAEEIKVNSPIVSVGLFKNGLAFIERIIEVPGSGLYVLEDIPEAVHGTFWVSSSAKVSARMAHRDIEVPISKAGLADWQTTLAGKEVTLYFSDERIPSLTGRVLKENMDSSGQQWDPEKKQWSRSYEQPSYHSFYSSYYSTPLYGSIAPPVNRTFLVLQAENSLVYIDVNKVAHLRIHEAAISVKQQKTVMLFDVQEAPKGDTTIFVRYLTKGMAWAPSYSVDISNPNNLQIKQQAVLKNEIETLQNTEISLISGFPSIPLSHVTSPLFLNTTWATFFSQLNTQVSRSSHASTSNMVMQQAMFNTTQPSSGIDFSATPQGEGIDLHYQSIGKQTLGAGDSLMLEIASAQAQYERISEWVIPDTRDANGQYVRDYEYNQNPEKYQDEIWDAIRFKNPFSFPMTTGPAMMTAKNRFYGQSMSYWVNSGEETTLKITKSLSIRSKHSEQEEEGGERDVINYGGRSFRKVNVKGEWIANNHRKEPVTLLIRRQFSGDLLSADRSPVVTLMEEGVYSVNKRNQLNWSIVLKPGEEAKINYRYTVLVAH